MNELTVGPRSKASVRDNPAMPSLWLVAALLIAHQIALTSIHYIIGPSLGFALASASLTAATIVIAGVLMLGFVWLDTREPGRASAALLVPPRWDRTTAITMLLALGIAQLPLGILALQGATIWQSGAPTSLAVGRALITTISGPAGAALLFATVLMAPIVEEVLYRGYLAGSLIARAGPVAAVLLSALLFVTLHFEPSNLVASFCLGVGAGLCAVRTRPDRHSS